MLPRGNVKKLIAFSSIEHMGFLLVGIDGNANSAFLGSISHSGACAGETQLFFSSASCTSSITATNLKI